MFRFRNYLRITSKVHRGSTSYIILKYAFP